MVKVFVKVVQSLMKFCNLFNHVKKTLHYSSWYNTNIQVGNHPRCFVTGLKKRLSNIADLMNKDEKLILAFDGKLMLNAAKCAIMQVSFGKTPPPALHILTNDLEIANVTTMTLLVTFTSNLKWDGHIQNLISRTNSKRYLLTVLRRAGTTTAHLLKFYVTFIWPGTRALATDSQTT